MAEYKILIPLDGSRLAERSLNYLPALRKLGEVKVELFSVVEVPEETGTLTPEEARERELNVLRSYLSEIAGDLREHLQLKVETNVEWGTTAAPLILEESGNFDPDLIVVSTHGRSGVFRWRLGSVADKVIRGALANTLVVGPKAAERAQWLEAEVTPPFKTILVPLDGSELAEQAIPIARDFAERFGSEIHFVRIVSPPIVGDSLGMSISYTADYLTVIEDAARDYLARVKGQFGNAVPVRAATMLGAAAPQLEEYATQNAIDLIILTTHGRGGLARAALGSVTDRLLGSVAPVLIVRPK